ncbi:hypothetical protein LUZ63_009488 [Rhynchospora breviuscula]|uniref:F-box domain-containing protein n=1 Tax=Rhynchospora breviuscula TaxID=2022672 RepID=A0A9Q0HP65_9POAL|nr:hypothetical protein LUZ63_009488 [Rhynchospora breviuscula]
MAMENPDEVDLFGMLPDDLLMTILSFLPTPVAARTSVLCRRFRHLWEASPCLTLTTESGSDFAVNFYDMADRLFFERDPSHPHPILSLHIQLPNYSRLQDYYIYHLIMKARSLRPRHLTIEGSHSLVHVLVYIFSIDSLESLSLPTNIGPYRCLFPSYFPISCPRLRTLSLGFFRVDSASATQLVSELCSLEDLYLEIYARDKTLTLSSQSIRKLTLIIGASDSDSKFHNLALSLPSLEALHFETRGASFGQCHMIHGQIPLLKTAVVSIDEAYAEDVTAVAGLLNFISHVEELSLCLKEEKYPVPSPILFEPGKYDPNFPNLNRLDVSLCFHDRNLDSVIMMLRNCPALESLKLVHKIPKFTDWAQGRKRKDWRSELPRNADGNRRYASFTNLHSWKNRKEFMKFLDKKCTFIRRTQNQTCVVS